MKKTTNYGAKQTERQLSTVADVGEIKTHCSAGVVQKGERKQQCGQTRRAGGREKGQASDTAFIIT